MSHPLTCRRQCSWSTAACHQEATHMLSIVPHSPWAQHMILCFLFTLKHINRENNSKSGWERSTWCTEGAGNSRAKNKNNITGGSHLYYSPTESSNRGVQRLTTTALHTEKVSVAGSGGDGEQARPRHHKSARRLCVDCLGNQSAARGLQLMDPFLTATRVNQGAIHLTNVNQ